MCPHHDFYFGLEGREVQIPLVVEPASKLAGTKPPDLLGVIRLEGVEGAGYGNPPRGPLPVSPGPGAAVVSVWQPTPLWRGSAAVDDVAEEGFFASDFTLAEIKTL